MNYWILLPLLIVFQPILIYAESDAQLEITVLDANNDSVNTWGLNFIVYQDADRKPFMSVDQVTNPHTLTLPKDHSYVINVYRNNMYADHFRVFLDKDMEHISRIPDLGGIRYKVLYNDMKPASGAQIEIFSHTGIKWASSLIDPRGFSERFWLQTTTDPNDEYTAKITIGEGLVHEVSNVKLSSGYNEEVITLPWSSVIDSPIKVKLQRDKNLPIYNPVEKFEIEVYDNNNKKIITSPVSSRGEANLFNISPGYYYIKVIKSSEDGTDEDIVWAIKRVLLKNFIKPIIIYGWDNDVQTAEDVKEPEFIEEQSTKTTCNCVAFRLDNIEDFYAVDIQKQIIDLFMQKQIPLTLGIIGNNIGTDKELTNYLQSVYSTHRDLIEIGNHGSTVDMTSLNKDDQSAIITNSNNQIFNTIGEKPTVFIPPFGKYDYDTISALEDHDIHYISSVSSFDLPPYSFNNTSLFHIPSTAATGYVEPGRAVYGKLANQTMTDIEYSLRDYGFAVVLLHPNEYSERDGWSFSDILYIPQYFELNKLIDNIKAKGLEIVTISEIEHRISSLTVKVPQWFKNTALLWSESKITNQEFLKSVEYLLDKRIIILPTQPIEDRSIQSQDIPLWFKNVAGLWAKNDITEAEFIDGLIFLVKQGIIIV